MPYLETYLFLKNNPIWMEEVALVDDAHPAAAGYEVLADWVWQWADWRFAVAPIGVIKPA